MMRSLITALVLCGLLSGPIFAEKRKVDHSTETSEQKDIIPFSVKLPTPDEGSTPLPSPQLVIPPARSDEKISESPVAIMPPKQLPATLPVEQLVVKSYTVSDLVKKPDQKVTGEKQLIAKILKNVMPKAWAGQGGEGTIGYDSSELAMVINQSEKVHANVLAYLETERRKMESDSTLIVKTHPVGDLVTSAPSKFASNDMNIQVSTKKNKTSEHELIAKIQKSIQPQSWKENGGKGVIEYYPLGMALVVNQTGAIQAEIEKFLGSIRDTNEKSISIECHYVKISQSGYDRMLALGILRDRQSDPFSREITRTVDESGLERIGVDFNRTASAREQELAYQIYLKDAEIAKLFQLMKEDNSLKSMAHPKVVVLNGETASVAIGQQVPFVRGLIMNIANDGVLNTTPRTEQYFLGARYSFEPTILEDGKNMLIKLTSQIREVVQTPVPSVQVTYRYPTFKEDGSEGEPTSVTTVMQLPKLNTQSCSQMIKLRSSQSALLYLGKMDYLFKERATMPWLEDVPVLRELLSKETDRKEVLHHMIVVKARIVGEPDEEEIKQASARTEECPKCCDSKIATLLSQYRKACADGRTDEARRFAIECIAIDPTCFNSK